MTEITTDQGSEIPNHDTTPAPPPTDEITRTDNRVPALPSPKELLNAVGDFSREMRDSLQEIRTAVEDSQKLVSEKLNALERRFNERFTILSNQVAALTQENIQVHMRLDDLENRVQALELDKRRHSEAP